jgi:iron complex outermembrane receptor protein
LPPRPVYLLLAGWFIAAPAFAADLPTFAIPPQSLRTAIVALAVQANISVSSGTAQACGPSQGVAGRLSVEEALSRVLAGTGCTYSRIDSQTFVIVRSPPREAAPKPIAAAPPAEVTSVNEIIVTAAKRSVGLSRAPYAVSVVETPDLISSPSSDIRGIAGEVSGLGVSNLGPGRDKLTLRGLTDGPLSGLTQSVVGLYLDDARLTYDAPDPALRLIDVDRVEVLRGPQGTLYGSGAIGGVIEIITHPPDLSAYSAVVGGGATTVEDGALGQQTDVVLNLPIVRDRLGLRLVAYDDRFGGYIDDLNLGLKNVGGTLREGARVASLWQIRDGWALKANFVSQTLKSNDSQYAFDDLGAYNRSLTLQEPSRNDFDGWSATLTGDLGWAKLKVSTAQQEHILASRYDATLDAPLFGGSGPTAFDEGDDIRSVTREATLTSPAGGRLTWIAGAFFSDYTHDRTAVASTDPVPLDLYNATRQDHTDETALYGELTWSVTDRLRLTGGARAFHLSVNTTSLTAQIGAQPVPFSGKHADHGIAPKVSAEFDATPNLIIYVQASDGYRASEFNSGSLAGSPYGSIGVGGQPYRYVPPDSLVSYEAGARWSEADDRLQARVAAYAMDWRDIQSERLSAAGLPFVAQIGNGRIFGLEGEGEYNQGPWRLRANLQLNESKVTAPAADLGQVLSPDIPGSPDLLANLELQRSLHWGPVGANLTASLGYVGTSHLVLSSVSSAAMGNFWTSRLGARLFVGRWTWEALIENVLGSRGDTFSYGNPFLVGHVQVSAPQPPRALSVRLTRAF